MNGKGKERVTEAQTSEHDTDDTRDEDDEKDEEYGGPDPEEDEKGDRADEDQGT
jgi:hypothetical protein